MLDSPDTVAAAFVAAWMRRDPDALAALFAEDADFVNVVGLWWEDRPAIAAAHRIGLTTFFARSRLALGRVKTRRLGGDAAVVHARLRLTGQTMPDGAGAGPRSTILVFMMQRRPSGWICVAAQNTDIVPGAETRAAGPAPVRYER